MKRPKKKVRKSVLLHGVKHVASWRVFTHVKPPAAQQELVAAILSQRQKLPDGVACAHPGCLSHVSHPCEGCGRIAGHSLGDQPWPLRDVVQKLCEATEILLNEKNYDGHGHEEISHALKVAHEWLGPPSKSKSILPMPDCPPGVIYWPWPK
jgi:hypothetical protein